MRSEYGSVEFAAEYRAAVSGHHPPRVSAPVTSSLTWLIARYRESGEWNDDLSEATRRQRDNIFKHVQDSAGTKPYSAVTKSTINEGIGRRSKTPSQARNFLQAMHGLFKWACAKNYIRTDPTLGIKSPKRKLGGGFPIWTESDADAYMAHHPIGTHERVWFDVLCFLGLRRGDAVLAGRQHVRDGVLTMKTEKSQGEVTVVLPILPILQRTLDAGPCGDLTFIIGKNGRPFVKESFGNALSEAARKAGVRKSCHGLRKIAATRAANAGATVAELNAIFGWKGTAMASLYTEQADRERLARKAMGKLAENDERTSIPAPSQKVRAKIGEEQ